LKVRDHIDAVVGELMSEQSANQSIGGPHDPDGLVTDDRSPNDAGDALKTAEWVRAVLNTTVDAIITINHHGVIVATNPATHRLFGYSEAELIGQNVRMLMPPPYRDEHDEYPRNYLRTGKARIIGIGREVVARRKDGSVFPIDLSVSAFDGRPGGPMFTGIIRDISQRQDLERQMAEVRTDEQRRISRELHDGLGGQMTGIGLLARSLELALQRERSASAGDAAELVKHIREAHRVLRDISHGLMPVDVAPEGLQAALRELVDRTQMQTSVPCHLKVSGELDIHDQVVALHVYRIAQEAISNAVRHGRPTRVDVSLGRADNVVTLRVEDNGGGFQGLSDGEAGMGLRTMMHRARIIGAMLDVRSAPDEGVVVTCTFSHEAGHGRSAPEHDQSDSHHDRRGPSDRSAGPETTHRP
jgi:PAS domain S-box-containing protein